MTQSCSPLNDVNLPGREYSRRVVCLEQLHISMFMWGKGERPSFPLKFHRFISAFGLVTKCMRASLKARLFTGSLTPQDKITQGQKGSVGNCFSSATASKGPKHPLVASLPLTWLCVPMGILTEMLWHSCELLHHQIIEIYSRESKLLKNPTQTLKKLHPDSTSNEISNESNIWPAGDVETNSHTSMSRTGWSTECCI